MKKLMLFAVALIGMTNMLGADLVQENGRMFYIIVENGVLVAREQLPEGIIPIAHLQAYNEQQALARHARFANAFNNVQGNNRQNPNQQLNQPAAGG